MWNDPIKKAWLLKWNAATTSLFYNYYSLRPKISIKSHTFIIQRSETNALNFNKTARIDSRPRPYKIVTMSKIRTWSRAYTTMTRDRVLRPRLRVYRVKIPISCYGFMQNWGGKDIILHPTNKRTIEWRVASIENLNISVNGIWCVG